MKLKNLRHGQTIIELVVVLGLAMVTVGLIVSVLLQGFKSDRTARNRAKATRLAEEEVALLEVVRDGMERDEFLDYVDTNEVWCDPLVVFIECHIDEVALTRVNAAEMMTYQEVEFDRSYTTEKPRVGCDADAIGVRIEIGWNEPSGSKQLVVWRCISPPAEYR